MNHKLHIILLVLGMITLMPSLCFSRDRSIDTLVLFRVWNYAKNHEQKDVNVERNVYMACTFNTHRRNPTLFLVPTMYSIAKGERNFVSESYYKMKFHDAFHYDMHRQVIAGTIPHHTRQQHPVHRPLPSAHQQHAARQGARIRRPDYGAYQLRFL